ncbi:hypothetical protein MAR_007409 [Mya arenaria]|uniref:DNA-directed DNA polymerase n=1 Tax=Mya arenaria TaxID=6604 RepID=A0ABY7DCC2_MYAAR|nr:hypothetical protein MAR_007409 [Mya arenaria]
MHIMRILKLNSYLHRLSERALYCDTDSITFTSGPGPLKPTPGDYLGDLTDEVPWTKETRIKGTSNESVVKITHSKIFGDVTNTALFTISKGKSIRYK